MYIKFVYNFRPAVSKKLGLCVESCGDYVCELHTTVYTQVPEEEVLSSQLLKTHMIAYKAKMADLLQCSLCEAVYGHFKPICVQGLHLKFNMESLLA